jgi:hypothetical protein
MNNKIKISTDNLKKIPSLKVDIVQNLVVLTHILPRKTQISGHFHLKTLIIVENQTSNSLIF